MADAGKAPEAAPVAETPATPVVKESAGATLIKAAEHVVIESATAIAKDLTAKSAADLKIIEKGLSQEVAAETKHGLPSLSEIGESIVDGVEVVAEEVVEGAEVALAAVEAHPELIAEAAIAVGIGVASIVQPELIVGSVAMIGKMAADSAKKTASEIAVTASTHVVNELGKDITEDVAKDAKVEATSTKTVVTSNETKVDEEKGVVVNTETKATSQKMKVVATGLVKSPTESGDAVPEAANDAKDTKAVPQIEGSSKDQDKSDVEVPKHEPGANGHKEATSVIVTGSGDKVSVKISDDGTITIGTNSTSEEKEVTETPIEPKPVVPEGKGKEPKKISEAEDSSKDNKAPSEVKVSPPGPNKVTEEIAKAASSEIAPAKQAECPEVPSPSKENGETKANSGSEEHAQDTDEKTDAKTEEPKTEDPKTVKIVLKTKALPTESATEATQDLSSAPAPTPPSAEQTPPETPQKLENNDKRQEDTLTSTSDQLGDEKDKQGASPVDTHVHDSLARLHEKLDTLLATASQPEPVKNEGPKFSQDDLDKIHLKLDKMQELLAIAPTPASSNGVEHVHQKIDAIHSVLISNKKTQDETEVPVSDADELPTEVEKDSRIDQLHQKFDTMQATLTTLTLALAQKPAEIIPSTESTDAVDVPPAAIAESSAKAPEPEPETEIAAITTETEPSNGLDTAKKDDKKAGETSAGKGGGESVSKDVEIKTKTPTKNVKRSSFFGGIFG